MTEPQASQPIAFKAETRQLLDILIHSLYSEREVFLREIISNASDALTRLSFEMLTNRNIYDAEAEAGLWITVDKDAHTLTLRDSGLGMNAAELAENLGTIAHSGARGFLQAAQQQNPNQSQLADIIGQFGVGFYSAFMVSESIRVVSRSFRPDDEAAEWFSSGNDTFTISSAEMSVRGTVVTLHLKEDALEFADEARLRAIIHKHSDYIPFPIYLGEPPQQVNQQTALWRQSPRQVKPEEYAEFYKELTLEMDAPLATGHLSVDAPVQLYALLFVSASAERGLFSMRKQDGLKLYARKVLIQDYCKDLLPEYFRYIQGVVDSEDLPLNLSRETIQSNRLMGQIKKLVTGKVFETLKSLAIEKPEEYNKFWLAFGRSIKEGAATDAENSEYLDPLLRFHSLQYPDSWISLDEYLANRKLEQSKIFYLLGEDERSLLHSPHLESFRSPGYDVLLMTDPLDSFVLLRLREYQGIQLANAASEALAETKEPTETAAKTTLSGDVLEKLLVQFKTQLGERVTDVRPTERLVESPARLVDPEGALNPEMQRVYRMLEKDYTAPKKVLEINPHHAILAGLTRLEEHDPRIALIIEQLYENALLVEGLHPNPASMVQRIQELIQSALPGQNA